MNENHLTSILTEKLSDSNDDIEPDSSSYIQLRDYQVSMH